MRLNITVISIAYFLSTLATIHARLGRLDSGEFVALDFDEAERVFGDELMLSRAKEGEHFRSQIAVPGFLYHGIGEDFVIVGKKHFEEKAKQKDTFVPEEQDQSLFRKSDQEESVDKKLTTWSRNLKNHHRGHYRREDTSEEVNGIYLAGDLTRYNARDLKSLLRNHEQVAFTKYWKGIPQLIVTSQCELHTGQAQPEVGAYYCVEGLTVCVPRRGMTNFYGIRTSGGQCGTLPLDNEVVEALPDVFRDAYHNVVVCNGGKCAGRR